MECCFHFLSLIGFKREKVISCLFFSFFSSSQEKQWRFWLNPHTRCLQDIHHMRLLCGHHNSPTHHQILLKSGFMWEWWERSTLFTLMYYRFHCFCTSWCFSCSRNCFWICCVYAVISPGFRYLISFSMRGWSFWYTYKNIAKGTTDPRVEFILPK